MATETVKQTHGFTDPLGKWQMQSQNPELYDPAMPRMYPIHRHIHIYSVARRGFKIKHPYFKGELKGCKDEERYVKCVSIPDPPQQLAINGDGKKVVEVEPRDEAGWRVAIDILNPNNPSTDPYLRMDAQAEAYYAIGKNVNLIKYGLFPSLNDPPTEAELIRAEKSRDDTRQEVIDEAFAEQASSPQTFRAWLREHPEINDAMNAFGVEADWFKPQAIKMNCPNCGDSEKAGVAYHTRANGKDCIIDEKRAAKAGVKSAA